MERALVVSIVERAVDRLAQEQRSLFDLDVNEQTVAQHIAAYIRDQIPPELSVDVEYNRHLNEKKVVLLRREDAKEAWAVVRPDIVVHQRGTDRSNVVALEVKKTDSNLAHDREKLEALVKQYGYLCAAHIVIGVKNGNVQRRVLWIA